MELSQQLRDSFSRHTVEFNYFAGVPYLVLVALDIFQFLYAINYFLSAGNQHLRIVFPFELSYNILEYQACYMSNVEAYNRADRLCA